ncbi:MAG: thioredoxin domain-containing protein [Kofleriaceae bacterium]
MIRASSVALFVLVTAAACDKGKPAEVAKPPEPAASAPSTATPTPGAPNAKPRFVTLANTGNFGLLVVEAANAARRDGYKPFLQFRAEWCKPCKAFDSFREDPKMASALAGVAVIQADLDAWTAEAQKLNVSATPTWLAIDANGQAISARRIDGGAWEADVPENMAPPLDKFFHAI